MKKINDNSFAMVVLVAFIVYLLLEPLTGLAYRLLDYEQPIVFALDVDNSQLSGGLPIVLYSRTINQNMSGNWAVRIEDENGRRVCGGNDGGVIANYTVEESGIKEFNWDFFFGNNGSAGDCKPPPNVPYRICGQWALENERGRNYTFSTCSNLINPHDLRDGEVVGGNDDNSMQGPVQEELEP